MFNAQNLWLFFIASLLLNLTPGNDMIYVASRSVSQGTRAGIISACGIFIGCMVHISAAILGLSFIIAKSAFLFELLKYLGAGYLIFLGIKSLITTIPADQKHENMPRLNKLKLLRQGIITNVFNPKVAIFFLSFLPQFVDSSSPYLHLQLLTLGAWFDIQGCLILFAVAWLAGKSSNFIKHNSAYRNIQRITGLVMIGLGIKVGLTVKQ